MVFIEPFRGFGGIFSSRSVSREGATMTHFQYMVGNTVVRDEMLCLGLTTWRLRILRTSNISIKSVLKLAVIRFA